MGLFQSSEEGSIPSTCSTDMIKTFCITLKTTPERKAKAAEHFAERGLIDVTFFEGIDNRAFGLKSTIKDMSPGQVGCILSHYMLWQTMTHMEGFTEAVVLEDDVRLHNDFADEVRGIQKYAPKDWEFIYLGHCFPTFAPTRTCLKLPRFQFF